jgi:ArsR family transcriptional regulator, arsenate/arsenite/antimonite-responsive transcriptional repressor
VGVETRNRQRLAISAKKCTTDPHLKSRVREFLIGSALTRRVVEEQDVPALCAALADRTRLRLLNLLNGRQVCICYLAEVLQTDEPQILNHLELLRGVGMVRSQRQGDWMQFRLTSPGDPLAAQILKIVLAAFEKDKAMQADLSNLVKASCAPLQVLSSKGTPHIMLTDASCSRRPS